jgi:hypothetical protein
MPPDVGPWLYAGCPSLQEGAGAAAPRVHWNTSAVRAPGWSSSARRMPMGMLVERSRKAAPLWGGGEEKGGREGGGVGRGTARRQRGR